MLWIVFQEHVLQSPHYREEQTDQANTWPVRTAPHLSFTLLFSVEDIRYLFLNTSVFTLILSADSHHLRDHHWICLLWTAQRAPARSGRVTRLSLSYLWIKNPQQIPCTAHSPENQHSPYTSLTHLRGSIQKLHFSFIVQLPMLQEWIVHSCWIQSKATRTAHF